MNDLKSMIRFAIIGAGALVLGYFVLSAIRSGGYKAGNAAGSIQRKF